MFKFLDTKSIIVAKTFFSDKDYCYHIQLRPKKKMIKTSQFKKIYIDEINKICKKISLKYDTMPSIPEVSTLFLSFVQNLNFQWDLFCEDDFYQVGLCDRYPINQLILELETIINLIKLDGSKVNILPVHINLRIHDNLVVHTHANVLVLDLVHKNMYLLEPKGHFNKFLTNLSTFFQYYRGVLSKIADKLNWSFSGYLVNNCNFQGSDNENCYLWTSWFEIICLLNYKNNIKNLRKYFKTQYEKNKNYPFSYLVSNYLLELYLED